MTRVISNRLEFTFGTWRAGIATDCSGIPSSRAQSEPLVQRCRFFHASDSRSLLLHSKNSFQDRLYTYYTRRSVTAFEIVSYVNKITYALTYFRLRARGPAYKGWQGDQCFVTFPRRMPSLSVRINQDSDGSSRDWLARYILCTCTTAPCILCIHARSFQ